jgi:hypothetical protein
MPTILTLQYTAYVQVSVPNAIARKLKEQDGVQNSEDAPFAFGNKWGDLYYQGEDGEEHMIEGTALEIDYKRTEEGEWENEEESDDEAEVDGDGFVVCAKCQEGGGKCDGECESESENN